MIGKIIFVPEKLLPAEYDFGKSCMGVAGAPPGSFFSGIFEFRIGAA